MDFKLHITLSICVKITYYERVTTLDGWNSTGCLLVDETCKKGRDYS